MADRILPPGITLNVYWDAWYVGVTTCQDLEPSSIGLDFCGKEQCSGEVADGMIGVASASISLELGGRTQC